MSELEQDNDYALVFDHFYTNNHIQILKSLIPFFDAGACSYLPVFIKYLELQHTIELTQKGIQPLEPGIKAASKQAPDLEGIYKAIKKYLAPHEEKSLQQILDMMHTMENIKEMQKMMELFQSMSNDDSGTPSPFSNFSGFEGMMDNNINMGDIIQLFNQMNQ